MVERQRNSTYNCHPYPYEGKRWLPAYLRNRRASIGYKILNEGEELKKQIVPQYSFDMMWTYGVPNGNDTKIDTPWSIYKDGDILHLQPGQQLLVNAKRIGYITAEKNFTIE